MDRSMPSFPVLHRLAEFAQTYVHWVGDANYRAFWIHSYVLFPYFFTFDD